MMTCFNVDMRITQYFNNILWSTPDYKKIIPAGTPGAVEFYKRWGMKSHNGIDCVPITGNDFSMFNFYAGKIVQILKDHPDYGNGIRIYIPEKKVVEYHNHMKFVNPNLKLFQEIDKKTFIGEMGNTGASVGAHNHLSYANVDETCFDIQGNLIKRLNINNGWLGYIDPMPFIKG